MNNAAHLAATTHETERMSIYNDSMFWTPLKREEGDLLDLQRISKLVASHHPNLSADITGKRV